MIARQSVRVLLVLAVAQIALILSVPIWRILEGPSPYAAVQIERAEQVGDEFFISATFTRAPADICADLLLFRAVGLGLGVPDEIPFRNVNGAPVGVSRASGAQGFHIALATEAQLLGWIDLRTRHDCGGVPVSRTFARIRNPGTPLQSVHPWRWWRALSGW